MSLISEFEIGLWNGWILSAIFLFVNSLVMFIAPRDNIKETNKTPRYIGIPKSERK